VKHSRTITGQGPQDYFVAVYFSRPTEVQTKPVVRYKLQGNFRPCLFGDLQTPAAQDVRNEYGLRKDGRPNHANLEYTPDPHEPGVNNVEITVRLAQVAANFRPSGSTEAADLPELLPRDEEGFKSRLRLRCPDLAGADFKGSALGIYVREAVCIVEGFAVEPL
jgi:hypothetical protein